MLLLDTSAWIDLFRKPQRLDLDRLGGLEEVVTRLPVAQEVLQGFRNERAACALRCGLTVIHRDRDFSALARISPLLERNLAA